MTDKVFCKGCRHLREPRSVDLFSAEEMNYPGAPEEWAKWQASRKDRQRAEMEMFDRNEDFYFEPDFFPWCEYWTASGESRWPADALGRTIKIYELAAFRNENHDCAHFTSMKDDIAEAGHSQADDETNDNWSGLKGF